MRFPLLALVICYAIFASCLYATMSELPPRIASHFDLAGHANGWMERDSYMIFTVGMALGIPIFMIGITALTGSLGRGMNIPHREYWLAPERRRSTVQVVMRFVVALAAVVVLLVTAIHWLIVRANAAPGRPDLNALGFWLVFGGFLAATGVWCGLLYRKFSRVP